VGAPENIEVVDVELKGTGRSRLLRIFIDKPGGVSHSDCEFVSKNVGTILDVEEVVPGGSYTLQVSSPGVERALKKPRDYERFQGESLVVRLREPVGGKRRWEGILASYEGGTITLKPVTGEPVEIALDRVERANLKFNW
jgi:ribosome maturation factor RimP